MCRHSWGTNVARLNGHVNALAENRPVRTGFVRTAPAKTTRLQFCMLLLTACIAVLASDRVWGQMAGTRRQYPPDAYYLALRLFDEGEFVEAAKAFRNVSSSGLRSSEARWVDSVCYYAMVGECCYQMGDLVQAMEQYTAAVNLFLMYPNWMLQVDFPPAIEPLQTNAMRPITWGVSGRRAIIGRFSGNYSVLQGRLDNDNVIKQGGVIALPEFMQVNVPEIVRCTALSIRRRREILGLTSSHDPLNTTLAATLGRRTPLNNWWQGWSDVLAGVAYAAQGNKAQAVGELQKSISLGGQYDHPLTSTALIELGRLSYEGQQYDAAMNFFLEASYSAAWFSQFREMEEAFRLATATYLAKGGKAMYPPLEPALAWSRRTSRLLECSLLTCAAQNAAESGDGNAALQLGDEAHKGALRTSMIAGSLGARLNYVSALANFQAGNVQAGETALNQLMAYQQHASRRLFEIVLVDNLARSGTDALPERAADELYSIVLREPIALDWVLDPVETLSVILTPPFGPLEHWFELAINRKDTDRALNIAELIRRRRFFSTLPMGGRLLALRAMLESPAERLAEPVRLRRQELLNRYPAFAELSRRSAELLRSIREIPPVPENEDAVRTQTKLFADWGAVSDQQERLLRDMALRRLPSDFLFPPMEPFKEIQSSLPDDLLVLSFLATSRGMYGLGCSQKLQSQWRIAEPAAIKRDLVEMLRQMGLVDRNQQIDDKVLRDTAWKKTGAKLLAPLTNHVKPEVWDHYREVVIIPDGVLWYLPFEALPVGDGDDAEPLITKIRVRYAPTMGFVPPDLRGLNTLADTTILSGQLFPKDEAWVAGTVDQMKKVSDRVSVLNKALTIPSNLLAASFNRLVVLDDIDPPLRGPYDWSPLPTTNERLRSNLASWIALPWDGPRQVVLPGFHTSAESALRKGGSGDEIFLAACGLMASGTRTALISRWRTGGQTSLDLTREFTQELPFCSACDAWQRSVKVVMDQELDLEREPRVRATGAERDLKATHPFFWAGYMLVDSGARPKDDAAPKPEAKPADGKPKPEPAAKPGDAPAPAAGAPADGMPKPEAKPGAKSGDKPGTETTSGKAADSGAAGKASDASADDKAAGDAAGGAFGGGDAAVAKPADAGKRKKAGSPAKEKPKRGTSR